MVISTTTSSVDYADAGCFSGGVPFLKEKRINTAQHDIAHIPSAGVDGTGSINYGFRTQKLSFTVIYVAGSEQAVLQAIKDDNLSMSTGQCGINVGGVSFARCFLDDFQSKATPKSTGLGDGNIWQECEIFFTCRGLL